MKIKEIAHLIENFAPLAYQESYDNSGLLIGDRNNDITSVLLCIDITEEVVDEAIELNANLIISHHPLIFSGLKRLNGTNLIERCVIKCVKNDIALYCAHTNIDSVIEGVNFKIAEKLHLKSTKILSSRSNELRKLVTFVPEKQADEVRQAIFNAGGGHIGNYDQCSFNISGNGTFRGNENSTPFVGNKGEMHIEPEIRIETIFPKYLTSKIIEALLMSHPYEEVAYDIYPLENKFNTVGLGVVGELEKPVDELEFLHQIKNTFLCKSIRHTKLRNKKIKRVAICGGSGFSFLKDAMNAQADIFITADVKYHQFFDAENQLIIADIGHFESEQFTTEIFFDILSKNLTNIAVQISKINTNPINYL